MRCVISFAVCLCVAFAGLTLRADNPLIRIMPMGDSITWGYDHADAAKYPGVTQKEGGYRIKLYEKLVAAGYNVEFCGSLTSNNPSDAPAAATRHEGWSGYTISRTFYEAYDPQCLYGGVLETITNSFKTAANPHVILLHLGSNIGTMGIKEPVASGLGMNGTETLKRYGLRDMSRLLDALSEKQPGARIVVTTLLNRDHHRDGTDTAQPGIVAFNSGLTNLVSKHVAKGQKVSLFDMNPIVPLSDMPDGIHPNETGYEKMAEGWFTAVTNLIPDASAFVPDNTPGIVSSTRSGTSASIWYNQAMCAGAGEAAHYSLGKPSVTVSAVALDGTDARKVNLTLSAALPDDETVELFAVNVTNAAETASSVKCTTPLVDLSSEGMACASGSGRISADDRITFVFRENGKVTIPRDGTVEVLLVGGGGGGGVRCASDEKQSAGGGGGGVVYKKAIRVTAGTYAVTVGAGGEVGADGGNSSVFGLTAYGGGSGANGLPFVSGSTLYTCGNSGGSGGGSSTKCSAVAPGGQATHAADDNFGNDGGSTAHVYGCGGGGGAGGLGKTTGGSSPANGGDGIEITMLGSGEYYGGGGAAYRYTYPSYGGLGGGGDSGKAGEDGRGGGGSGGMKGGSGLVAVSYAAPSSLEGSPDDDEDFDVAGGDEEVVLCDGKARIFRRDGTLSVTGSGYLELLIVGGGGGGGIEETETGASGGAGGGGAGGLLHYKSILVEAGSYAVTVGAGGGVGTNGDDTVVSGFDSLCTTAYGGGAGGMIGGHGGSNGASGGGASYNQNAAVVPGGSAIYGNYGVLGNAGGSSYLNFWGAGGGGGASEPGGSTTTATPGSGGNGYCCTILGTNGWYAGGGAATRTDHGRSSEATGGKGGGGSPVSGGNLVPPYGTAGVDGLGGGGAGGMPGGSGAVIVRYRKADPGYATEFRGATGGSTYVRNGYRIHTFTESGTFTMPCMGCVDVLLVGGGGGGGSCDPENSMRGGGGGGAGGFVYTDAVLDAGTYAITVGAGGNVSQNGGNTSAFAGTPYFRTAYGGGEGADFDGSSKLHSGDGPDKYGKVGADGASGGGATHIAASNSLACAVSGGQAIYASEWNCGNAGGWSTHVYAAAGGGGAGGVGGNSSVSTPGAGGIGKACSITGEEVYYAGGGAGFRGSGNYNISGGLGGGGSLKASVGSAGEDGKGGGGCGGQKGGSGIVIIRYKLSKSGTVIVFR